MATKPRHRFRHVNIPKEFKTRLLHDESARFRGDKENGKYYKCSNCGQVCHDREHALGGSNSGDGITHLDFSIVSNGLIPGNKGSAISILGTLQFSFASLALNSSGGTKTVVHSHRATMDGCPLCGSLNYAGFYP